MDFNRKEEIKDMASEVGHDDFKIEKKLVGDTAPIAPVPVKEVDVRSLKIPKCSIKPSNGRIFVIEVSSAPPKTKSGLWLPKYHAVKKDDTVAPINRYFVVDWDKADIPESITKHLKVGLEIYTFFPEDAMGLKLPRVIDWSTGEEFSVFHYTELAGLSRNDPEEVE